MENSLTADKKEAKTGLLDVGDLKTKLSYDPSTGEFTWLVNAGPRLVGSRAGSVGPRGYRRLACGGERYEEHRVAWLFIHGRWPADLIDHVNGDASDNRAANLREASRSQNAANSKARSGSSKLKGASFHKATGLWQSQIMVRGNKKYLGLHDTEEAAHMAYAAAATEAFSEFARVS